MSTNEILTSESNDEAPIEESKQLDSDTITESNNEDAPLSPDERLQQIKRQEQYVQIVERNVKSLKSELKIENKLLDREIEKLRKLVREYESNGSLTEKTSEDNQDAWRLASISDLNLQPSVEEKLRESDITNIGELEDFRGGKGLHNIKGIGEAKVTQIEDALLEWLDQNRDRKVMVEAATTVNESLASTSNLQ